MLPLAMQAQGKRYYVTKEAETAQTQGDGSSWSTAMTLERAIGTAKAKWMEKETSRGTILFSRRLRKALDPKGLLNPTKLVSIR